MSEDQKQPKQPPRLRPPRGSVDRTVEKLGTVIVGAEASIRQVMANHGLTREEAMRDLTEFGGLRGG
jgi:hypothetical protein